MKSSHAILAILFVACPLMRAQVVPDVTGPTGLPLSGTLNYDLRYSQTSEFGGGQNGQQWSFVSGDASYANTGKRLPFTMQYGGGYGRDWGGNSASAGNVFQHLSLSQGFVGRAWSLSASDSVSYTFQTPTTGFSGVPGTGEPIGGSGSTTSSDQTILTLNTRMLDNTANAGFQGRLNHAWTLNIGGSSAQMRFIDNNGQDSNTLTALAGFSCRLNALNSISVNDSYSRYSYSGSDFSMGSDSLLVGYQRQWNRRFNTSVSAGPTFISDSGLSGTGLPASPNQTMLSITASAGYQLRHATAQVSYSRGTNSGSGYLLGARSDNVGANISRNFGKDLTVGATGSYMRTSSLLGFELITEQNGQFIAVPINSGEVTNSRYGGLQVSRRLGRFISAFANYTAIDQSSSLQISALGYNSNLLGGLYQVIGFGIGYSPQEKHLEK